MPRIIVTADPSPFSTDVSVWLDEHVHSVHLSTDQAAAQFVERLAWAISDAENADSEPADHRVRPSRQPRRHSSAARSHSQRRVRA
ncbi:MAG: hypothetical protein ABSG95_15340 [Solirubrobacteraceae bacterium]|jgi:hypothetical protein